MTFNESEPPTRIPKKNSEKASNLNPDKIVFSNWTGANWEEMSGCALLFYENIAMEREKWNANIKGIYNAVNSNTTESAWNATQFDERDPASKTKIQAEFLGSTDHARERSEKCTSTIPEQAKKTNMKRILDMVIHCVPNYYATRYFVV